MSKQKETKPEPKTIPLNALNVVVKNATNSELINEVGTTVVCLLMQEDGKVMTSFMGDYNKGILTTLEKVNATYFKSLKNQLLKKKKAEKPEQPKKEKSVKDEVKSNKKPRVKKQEKVEDNNK